MKWLRNIACLLTLAALSAAASPINLAGSKGFAATPPVGGGSSPAWVQNIAVGKWARIAGPSPTSPFTSTSTLAGVDPDPDHSESYNGNPGGGTNTHQESVLQSFGGGAFVRNAGTYGKYVLYNGGHHNYFGNEVYTFDLETLTWTVFSQPYNGPISFPISGTCGYWPAQGVHVNGSPSVPHTYDLLESDGDSFYSFRAQTNESPAFEYCVSKLPVSTGVAGTGIWQKKDLSTSTVGSGGWSVHDTLRHMFVYRGGGGGSVSNRTIQYDYINNTHAYFNPSGTNITQTDSVAAYDPVDDLVVVYSATSTNFYSTPAGSLGTNPTLLTEGGSPPTKAERAGFEWSTAIGGFLYYSQGASVYSIKNIAGTWTWALLTSGSNTVVPEDIDTNSTYVYSKFRIAEYADGVSVAIVAKTTTGGIYAFRISALIEPLLYAPAANEPEYEEIALAA